MKYFSMFTGVGGFELGIQKSYNNRYIQSDNSKRPVSSNNIENELEQRKCKCVGVCEIDKYASQLLAKRFEGVKNYGCATKINTDELPEFDLLVGGFPCQAFSIAGKRRGFDDTRGTLFFEVARILKAKRPKNFVLENVKGLLSHDKGKTFRVIIDTLTELGYDVQWMVLNSKFFGVPQNRERVFIIGSIRGTSRPEILPFGETTRKYNEKQLSGQETTEYKEASKNTKDRGGQSKNMVKQIGTRKDSNSGTQPFQQDRVYDVDGISPALQQSLPKGSHKIKEDLKIRRLTPVECERLQGFPGGWTEGFSDTQRYKMMGNAVTVNVVEAIMNKLAGDNKYD